MRKEKTKSGTTPVAASQSFYINNEIFDLITLEAEEDDRSRSYIVNKILEKHYIAQGMLKPKKQKSKRSKSFKK